MRQGPDFFTPLRGLALFVLVVILGGLAALASYLPASMRRSAMDAALASNMETIDQTRHIRDLYAQAVVARARATGALTPSWDWRDRKDAIPLPATLIKEVSALTQDADTTLSLISPYPWPHRSRRTMDSFESDAWEKFQVDPTAVMSRQEVVDGRRVLRVAVADRMASQACVDCHNSDPQSPRTDWRVGDVRGVFEATRVVEPFLASAEARGQTLLTALAAAGAAAVGAIVVLLVLFERRDREKRAADRAAYHLAEHDALTGLKNRRSLRAQVEAAFNDPAGPRYGALLLIDLDAFKPVNDTYGHAAGDALLAEVAARLRALAGARDMLARLGGDEFALLRAGPALSGEELYRLCRVVCEALSRPYQIDGLPIAVGACVGAGLTDKDGGSAEDLFAQADLALYAAKAAGRSQHRVFEPGMMAGALKRAQLGLALRAALETDALTLFYQPIVDARSGAVEGFEALMRWRRADGSFTPPNEFIPVAEENGLIVPLGAWALRRACREMARFDATSRICVNLSCKQLDHPGLIEDLKAALAESGLAPERLDIEITESMMLREDPLTLELLQTIRDMGVGVAIDDFGTGYSCLSYLRDYPVTAVKIDRAFVAPLEGNGRAEPLVTAIVALAHALGLRTVAEGVETARQAETLAALGCDTLQGYHFGKPLPLPLPSPADAEDAAVASPLPAA